MTRPSLLFLVTLACAAPVVAAAQETRAEIITRQQAEKATRLAPYVPHWSENLLIRARRALAEQSGGFYPSLGSVYSGGGFTLGAGYRHFTGDRTNWNVAGLYSVKSYKLIEVSATSPGHLSGRLDVHGAAFWRDATRVRYHGLGIDSPEDMSTGFRMQQTSVGAGVTGRPQPWLALTAGASYENYTLKDPLGDVTPVEAAFTPDTAPGLGIDPAYVHTTAGVAIDSRPAVEYARRGGLYGVALHHYADQDSVHSFDRLNAEAVQHITILRENWVISLRGRLESTLGDDDLVPYFLLPSLGSGSTLRGYRSWRFRDRHAALLSGEWRWIANRMALDLALFYDAGMVAPRFDALALSSFVSDVGIGIRLHTPASTPLRIELAQGAEGLRVVFASGAAF